MPCRVAVTAIFAAGIISACTDAPADDPAPVERDSEAATEAAETSPASAARAAQYSCSGPGGSMEARFLDQDDMVEIIMPALSEEPLVLTCQSTRVGPECSEGDTLVRFDILTDTASVKTGAGLTTECTLAVPE